MGHILHCIFYPALSRAFCEQRLLNDRETTFPHPCTDNWWRLIQRWGLFYAGSFFKYHTPCRTCLVQPPMLCRRTGCYHQFFEKNKQNAKATKEICVVQSFYNHISSPIFQILSCIMGYSVLQRCLFWNNQPYLYIFSISYSGQNDTLHFMVPPRTYQPGIGQNKSIQNES